MFVPFFILTFEKREEDDLECGVNAEMHSRVNLVHSVFDP